VPWSRQPSGRRVRRRRDADPRRSDSEHTSLTKTIPYPSNATSVPPEQQLLAVRASLQLDRFGCLRSSARPTTGVFRAPGTRPRRARCTDSRLKPTLPDCVVPARAIWPLISRTRIGRCDHLVVSLPRPGVEPAADVDQLRGEIGHFSSVCKDLDPDRHHEAARGGITGTLDPNHPRAHVRFRTATQAEPQHRKCAAGTAAAGGISPRDQNLRAEQGRCSEFAEGEYPQRERGRTEKPEVLADDAPRRRLSVRNVGPRRRILCRRAALSLPGVAVTVTATAWSSSPWRTSLRPPHGARVSSTSRPASRTAMSSMVRLASVTTASRWIGTETVPPIPALAPNAT
jgi:hypothetical protein